MKAKIIFLIFIIMIFSAIEAEEFRTIHVFVALCDNLNQGIVPVPDFMGDGKDTTQNLYWSLAGGVKTYFKNSKEWKLIKTIKDPKEDILERVVFKHKTAEVYLLADAYDGAKIRKMLQDFMNSSSGNFETNIKIDNKTYSFGGNADLVSYIGHDAYMDGIILVGSISSHNRKKKDAIILACLSQKYFSKDLKKTGANPLVWTTGLMAPEAYTLKWAIDGWIVKESAEEIRERASQAYNKYQRCGIGAARKLLVTGW